MIPFICDLDEGRVACWMRAVGRADASWSVASVKSVTGGHGAFALSTINNSHSLTKRAFAKLDLLISKACNMDAQSGLDASNAASGGPSPHNIGIRHGTVPLFGGRC